MREDIMPLVRSHKAQSVLQGIFFTIDKNPNSLRKNTHKICSAQQKRRQFLLPKWAESKRPQSSISWKAAKQKPPPVANLQT
jgi:hypothetical protein